MEGLLKEGNGQIEEYEKGSARDAALIEAAQKCEHYEIAAYGTLRNFARALGHEDCAKLFIEILDQESATDEKLTKISDTVNKDALA